MREIEVKAQVADKAGLLARIAKQQVSLSAPLKQHDVVFGPPGFAVGSNWLRIRIENDQTVYFTLKKSVNGSLDNLELEVKVNNATEMERIVRQLGYELFSDITKTRQKAKVGDIEVCIDDVEGLGTFIEAELLMPDDADHDVAVQSLWQLLSSFGVPPHSEVHEGYDVLVLRAKGKLPMEYKG
ncbi:MAG TPA: class IV adenylate cyclase [Candidatus Saccharimonadales bacterium]|nr:class IV adenylate cyclase [Candidatus Saccharimonadales bacterium]